MKLSAATLSIHKAVGLHIGEHEIAMSYVAATVRGPVEIGCQHQPYVPEDLTGVLEQMLAPLVRKRRRLLVAVGLPASRVFYTTRSLRGTDGSLTPEALFQKALQSPTICIDDMIVDLLKAELNKTPMASIAACRRRYLGGLVGSLKRCGIQPFRIEPAPCALLRTAVQRHRAPRRARTVIRIFLDGTQGLAIMVAGSLPLAWRHFEITPGNEESAVLSAVRTLRTLDKYYGLQSSVDAVLVHGGADLHPRFMKESFAREVGCRVFCYEGPHLDGGQIAFGSALGCLKQEPKVFDLSRSLKPRASLWEIFPWGELALQSALVGCIALSLMAQAANVKDACQVAQGENHRHKCLASTSRPQLEKERKDLQEKVEAIRNFLDTRVLWTEYTRDIPARLPPNAVLTSFRGINDAGKGGKGAKRQLLLGGSAPIASDNRTPREIDEFLSALRNDPLLKRDLPLVSLADIRRSQGFGGAQAMASFTVVCSPGPKSAGGGAAGNGQKDNKKAEK